MDGSARRVNYSCLSVCRAEDEECSPRVPAVWLHLTKGPGGGWGWGPITRLALFTPPPPPLTACIVMVTIGIAAEEADF